MFGAIAVALPLMIWWLEPATVQAISIAVIASAYIGFAVADGRPRVIVAETVVAAAGDLPGVARLSWRPTSR